MKVLFIRTKKRKPDNNSMRSHLRKKLEYHEVVVSKFWEKKLPLRMFLYRFDKYDAIIFDLRFKACINQTDFFVNVSKKAKVFFLEEDACQNFIKKSPWYGRFSKFYKAVGNVAVLCTGYNTEKMLIDCGVHARMIPKGYDNERIMDLEQERSIEFGFIGKTENVVYENRKKTLRHIQDVLDLKVFTTEPGDDYINGLNKIRFFISADAGLGEYMVKNFEAMASGCILIAYEIGSGEEESLGFKDMDNVILYRSVDELLEKNRYCKERSSIV